MGTNALFRRLRSHPASGKLAVFLSTALFFGFLQMKAGFADPDSFYHIKMILLTGQQGPVADFPWLPLTVLANGFADHHFLYHVALVPFLALGGPIIGMKLATSLLAGTAALTFYWLLQRLGLNRVALLVTGLMVISGGFMLRMSLAKTPAVMIIWILLTIAAWHLGNRKAIFFLAFAHVWLHGSWPLALVIAATYLVAAWLTESICNNDKRPVRAGLILAWKKHGYGLLAAAGGLTAGLIINPFFPENLTFYWEQLVQIAVINHGNQVPVGTEWHPFSPKQAYRYSAMLVNLSIASITALVLLRNPKDLAKSKIKPEMATLTFFAALLTGIFLAMTMRQSRHIELFIPALALFTACLASIAVHGTDWKRLMAEQKRIAGRAFGSSWVILAIFIILTGRFLVSDTLRVRSLGNNHPIAEYEAASAWLAANSNQGDLVLNSRWDDFPNLFYHNQVNAYFAGLDPTFTYRANPELWQDHMAVLNQAEERPWPSEMLERTGARYYLMRRSDRLPPDFSRDPRLELAYQDDNAAIFRLK